MDKKELEDINMTLEEARKTLMRDLVNTLLEKEGVSMIYYLIASLCSQENCDSADACRDSVNTLEDIRHAVEETEKLSDEEKKTLCEKIGDCIGICDELLREFPETAPDEDK